MSVICIIPARRKSRRLPEKNTRPVLGKPLLTYAVETAMTSKVFEGQVYVSTEDEDIGMLAIDSGAMVIWRPRELSENEVRVKEVVVHALDYLHFSPEYVAVIHATACLLTPEDIQNMWGEIRSEGHWGIMTIVRPAEHPLGALEDTEKAGLVPHLGQIPRPSEEWPELWMDAGAAYIYRTDMFREYGFYPPHLAGAVLPRTRAWDIDVEEDIEMVEALLAYQTKGRKVEKA